MTTARQDELWRRWRAGEPISVIARTLEMPLQHVQRFLAQTGGVRQSPPRRRVQHLTMAEREEISRGVARGCSAREIAALLGRSPSTIAREIARNGGRTNYRAAAADERAYQRARRPKPAKLARSPLLRALVEEKLAVCWSPEQIAGWLRRLFPADPAMRISHEAIYLTLFDPRRKKAIDRTLWRKLRSGRRMRHPKRPRRPDGRGMISDLVSISERPPEVEDRLVAGHWEGDLVRHEALFDRAEVRDLRRCAVAAA